MTPLRSRPSQEPGEGPFVHGIVLAGAFGWRVSPFEALGPKPCLPVALTPLIGHVLAWLHGGGVRRVTLCTNRASGTPVRRCLPPVPAGVDLDHAEDWTPRGAAGCGRDAGHDSPADLFLVVEGSILPIVDLDALVRRHVHTGAAVTVVARRHEETRAGAGSSRLSPTGIYVFDRRVLSLIPEVGYQDLKEGVVKRLNEVGERVLPYEDLAAPRVSCFQTFLAANTWLVERMIAAPAPPPGFRALSGALVHDSARIDAGATLVGPVLVGPGARVLEGAILVGPAVVGAGCTVGAGALFTRSVSFARASVGARAVVDGSVLAERAAVSMEACVTGIVVPASAPASVPVGSAS